MVNWTDCRKVNTSVSGGIKVSKKDLLIAGAVAGIAAVSVVYIGGGKSERNR